MKKEYIYIYNNTNLHMIIMFPIIIVTNHHGESEVDGERKY